MLPKKWKEEIWSIPNLLSILRLILIPVYMTIYLNADSTADYNLATAILAVSCLTDLLDGKIARRFNMITNLGKFLDPLADKFTQLALIVCLSARYKALRYFLVVFLAKEFWQLYAMLSNMKRGKVLNGALTSGKVSTTVLFVSFSLMFLCPQMNERLVNILTLVSLGFLLYAFADYASAYFGKNNKLIDMEG